MDDTPAKKPSRMTFRMVPDWLLRAVNANAIKVWCGLMIYNGLPEGCHPSVESLCYDLVMSKRTIRRAISDLVKVGAITVRHGYRKCNHYTLYFDGPEKFRRVDFGPTDKSQ